MPLYLDTHESEWLSDRLASQRVTRRPVDWSALVFLVLADATIALVLVGWLR